MIGKTIGSYTIVERISQGGMGIVFRGVHNKLEQPVAIKMLAPHLSGDPEMRARFLREARLQAKLSHPAVVNIFDYFEDEGNIFLVMEFVPGQSLEQMLLDRGKLPPKEVLDIAQGVLSALSFMHGKGIIHRDIKPGNIIISEQGIKVTDFGIARLAEAETSITKDKRSFGTLCYMAPELLKTGEISPAIDIYSLGVTLFQLLCGVVPFSGATYYELIHGHLEKEPPSLHLLHGIPVDLESVIKKALAKKPQERYESADDFLKKIIQLNTTSQTKPVSITIKSSKSYIDYSVLKRVLFSKKGLPFWGLLFLSALSLIIYSLFPSRPAETNHPPKSTSQPSGPVTPREPAMNGSRNVDSSLSSPENHPIKKANLGGSLLGSGKSKKPSVRKISDDLQDQGKEKQAEKTLGVPSAVKPLETDQKIAEKAKVETKNNKEPDRLKEESKGPEKKEEKGWSIRK